MNVFKHELRVNFASALLWAASLSIVGLGVALIAPVFVREAQPMIDMIRASAQFFKALAFDESALNSFNGLYSVMMMYVVLCAAVQGLTLGMRVIAKEGARKTSDFLFSKPLSRSKILLAKYAAAFVLALMVSACYTLVTYPACRAAAEAFDAQVFLLLSGALCLTQLACVSIGFCVGCFVRRIKSPNAVGIGIGAMFFAIVMVENLSEQNSIAFLSPLCYLNPRYIAAHRAYDAPYAWALVVLTAALMLLGVWRYKTRDIHAA